MSLRRSLLLLPLLTACASGPAPVPPEAPAASRGSEAGETPAVTVPGGGGTATQAPGPEVRLLREARELRSAGDLDASFSRLDRALRIAPQSGEVYLEFARSYLAAGNAERAAASAQRGLLFCSGRTCAELRKLAD